MSNRTLSDVAKEMEQSENFKEAVSKVTEAEIINQEPEVNDLENEVVVAEPMPMSIFESIKRFFSARTGEGPIENYMKDHPLNPEEYRSIAHGLKGLCGLLNIKNENTQLAIFDIAVFAITYPAEKKGRELASSDNKKEPMEAKQKRTHSSIGQESFRQERIHYEPIKTFEESDSVFQQQENPRS